jgi:hypothetical protein
MVQKDYFGNFFLNASARAWFRASRLKNYLLDALPNLAASAP